MQDIAELKEKRSHALYSAKDIATKAKNEGGRILTKEETAAVAAYIAEADALGEQIEAIKANEKILQDIDGAMDVLGRPESRRTAATQPADGPKASASDNGLPKSIHRYGELKAFKGQNADLDAYATGQWLIAQVFPQQSPLKASAHRWCKEHGVYDGIQNVMSTTGTTSGANLIPTAMEAAIIQRREVYGIFRQWADLHPMSSDSQVIPVETGVGAASFYGENPAAGVPETDDTYTNIQLFAKKLGRMTRMSTELSEDAIVSMADRVTSNLAYALAYKEDLVGFTGTGISTDGGINGIIPILQDGSHTASWYEPAATHDLFSEIDNADITAVMARLPQWARGDGCAFFCSQVCADAVFGRLKAVAGGNTISELAMAGITQLGQKGIVGTYLGYPIVTSQVLPSVDAGAVLNDKVMLLFGNLRLASVLGERRGITVSTTTERYWELDQIGLKVSERIDINNHGLGTDTVAGAIIGLRGSTS